MRNVLKRYGLPQLTVVAVALAVVSCAALQSINPFENADDVPLKALASYGMYVVSVEASARVSQDPESPPEYVDKLRSLERAAGPFADGMYDATLQLIAMRHQLAAGTTTEERVAIASKELDGWVSESVPIIAGFYKAVVSPE